MRKFFYIILMVMISSVAFSNSATNKDTNDMKGPVYLKVEVINEMGNKVHGAKVQLFNSEEDYRKEENVIRTEYTDKSGKITFKGLDQQVYYLLVEKDNMDNDGGAVKTDTLKDWRVNKVTVVIQ
jgi:hypothetical protein